MNQDGTTQLPAEREPTALEERSKAHFLAGEILDAEAHPQLYSLEAEFRDSAGNRDYKFYVVIAGFLIVLIASTIAIAKYVERRYRQVDVSISEFQDMNLKALLDAARTEEQKLRLAEKALAALGNERERELQRIKETAAKERESILSSSQSAAEKRAAVAANRRAEEQKLATTNRQYAERVRGKQSEVRDLRETVSRKRTEVRDGVSKAERIVSNYDRLHQIRMQRQKAYYENRIRETVLRYNPHFRNRRLRAITARSPRSLEKAPAPGTYHSSMSIAGMGRGEYAQLRRQSGELFLLLGRLDRIPFRNSTAPAVRGAQARAARVVRSYETLRVNLSRALAGYRYALDYYARLVPESGYVIDARGGKEILVHIKPVVRVRGGERAVVFRGDSESVGELELQAGGRTALVVSTVAGKRIQPFDRILVRVGGRTSPADSKSEGKQPVKETQP